jgi:hypothetical protein
VTRDGQHQRSKPIVFREGIFAFGALFRGVKNLKIIVCNTFYYLVLSSSIYLIKLPPWDQKACHFCLDTVEFGSQKE